MADNSAPEGSNTDPEGFKADKPALSESFEKASAATTSTPVTQSEINHIAGLTLSGQGEGLVSGLSNIDSRKKERQEEKEKKSHKDKIAINTTLDSAASVTEFVAIAVGTIKGSFIDRLFGLNQDKTRLETEITKLEGEVAVILSPLYREAENLSVEIQTTSYIDFRRQSEQLKWQLESHPEFARISTLKHAAFWDYTASTPLGSALLDIDAKQIMTIYDNTNQHIVYTDDEGHFITQHDGERKDIPEEAINGIPGIAVNKPATMGNIERLASANAYEEADATFRADHAGKNLPPGESAQVREFERIVAEFSEASKIADDYLSEINSVSPGFSEHIKEVCQKELLPKWKDIFKFELSLDDIVSKIALTKAAKTFCEDGSISAHLQSAIKIDQDGEIISTENDIKEAVNKTLAGKGFTAGNVHSISAEILSVLKEQGAIITMAPTTPEVGAPRDTATSSAPVAIDARSVKNAFSDANTPTPEEAPAPEEAPKPSFSSNFEPEPAENPEIDPDATFAPEELQRTNE